MPPASRAVSAWPGLTILALAGTLVASLVALGVAGPAAGLSLAAWLFVAPITFLGTAFFLHCAPAESRPDRLAPMASLFLFLPTATLSVAGPAAALFAMLSQSPGAAIAAARSLALAAVLPCLVFFLGLVAAVVLGGSGTPPEFPPDGKSTGLPRA